MQNDETPSAVSANATSAHRLVFREVLGQATPEEAAELRRPERLEAWRDELLKYAEEAHGRIRTIHADLREANHLIFANGPTKEARTRWHHTEDVLNRKLRFWHRYVTLANQRLRECKELMRQRNLERAAAANGRPQPKREAKEYYGLGYQEGWYQAVHSMKRLMESGTTRAGAIEQCLAFLREDIRPWTDAGGRGLPPSLKNAPSAPTGRPTLAILTWTGEETGGGQGAA